MTPVEKDETRRDESEKGYSMWLVISLILGIIVGLYDTDIDFGTTR